MDKRGIRILISCIACAAIVLVLFIIALRFSRLSCELISVEPAHLRHAQLEWANNQKRHKPTRSHDKLMLMKMAAYLEYHIEPTASERAKWDEPLVNSAANSLPASNLPLPSINNNVPLTSPASIANNSYNNNNNNMSAQRPAGQLNISSSTVSSPAPPVVQNSLPPVSPFPTPAQLNNNQTQQQHLNKPTVSNTNGLRAEKRFLPLQLESIETRSLASDGQSSPSSGPNAPATTAGNNFNFLTANAPPMHKQKYILTFNCTKLNMVFVYQANRVWVESMSLELKPTSRGEKKCQLQLPSTGAFAVDSTLASPGERSKWPGNLAHYYCNKPLKYLCYHYSSKSGPSKSQGILLAELHINSIEFETIVGSSSSSSSGVGETNAKSDKKQVKHEFKGKRKDCDVGN